MPLPNLDEEDLPILANFPLDDNDGDNKSAVHEPLDNVDEVEFHEQLGGDAAVRKQPYLSDNGDTAIGKPLNEKEETGGKPLHKVAVSLS